MNTHKRDRGVDHYDVINMNTEDLVSYLRTKYGDFSEETINLLRTEELDAKALLYSNADSGTLTKLGFKFGPATKLAAFINDLKNPIDEDKRKRTDAQQTRIDILNYFQQILELTPDKHTLSDPKIVLHIPYPFKGPHRPSDRFDWNVKGEFTYYGRKDFDILLSRVLSMRLRGGNGYKELYITGIFGSGKSHLICALVCHLMKINKRVVYAPDARWLISDPFRYLRDSLQLAFADDSQALGDIQLCENLHGLELFSEKIAAGGTVMYVFLDQANALDEESAGRSSASARAGLSDFLHRFTYGHFFIQIASGNFAKANRVMLTQENVDKLQFNIGLKDDENAAMWARLACSANVSPQFKEIVEDLTGCNPLLMRGGMSVISNATLSITAESMFNEEFENEMLDCMCVHKDWLETTSRIEKYAWDFLQSRGEDERKLFFSVMERCILEDTVNLAEISILDTRNFYIDPATGTGRCSSGLAKRTIAKFLRKHAGSSTFLTSQWLNMVQSLGDNASVLGFLVEQVLLSQIEKNGMVINGIQYSHMETMLFDKYPILPQSIVGSPVLYVPKSWNYTAIDAIVFLLEEINGLKVLRVIPMQITLNKQHKNSETSFFSNLAEFSKRTINAEAYDKIAITFLWVVENLQDHLGLKEEEVPLSTKYTRGALYHTPVYTRMVRTVAAMSEIVGRKLETARQNALPRKGKA